MANANIDANAKTKQKKKQKATDNNHWLKETVKEAAEWSVVGGVVL